MRYIQLFKRTPSGTLSPILGSSGLLLVDGRWGLPRARAFAQSMCRVRGAIAFQILAGQSLRESHPITQCEAIREAHQPAPNNAPSP